MKTIVITTAGPPEVLKIEDRAIPEIQPNEVLVRVHYAGINRPDVLQRMGKYNAPEGVVQDIPGLEISGVIEQVGTDVKDRYIDEEVMALLPGGGYAEYVAVPTSLCIPIPKNISLAEAATLPETLYTVWNNVFEVGKLKAGERILIHGGAGGIGSTAIQMARIFGATVYTTVSSEQKAQYCASLGAQHIVNYLEEDYADRWKNERIDLVLDSIGGDYFDKNIDLLAEDGRLIYINAMKGAKVTLNLIKLMQKRIVLTGSTLRGRNLEFKTALTQSIQRSVLPLIERGKFVPQLQRVYSFEQIIDAHHQMEQGQIFGKIAVKF